MIQWGKQDLMFAGGHEDLDWTMSNLFDAMGAMSSKYNEVNPATASRAYDVSRDGFVIAEGAANYGVDLAFTPAERIAYERSVILPMAGLDGEQLELYYRYFALLDQLNFARNEVARYYLYGGMPREQAIEWLMEFGLESRGTASQRLDFIAAMRSYVINYNYGKSLVRDYVESQAGPDREARWQVFQQVLSTPIQPQQMRQNIAQSVAE